MWLKDKIKTSWRSWPCFWGGNSKYTPYTNKTSHQGHSEHGIWYQPIGRSQSQGGVRPFPRSCQRRPWVNSNGAFPSVSLTVEETGSASGPGLSACVPSTRTPTPVELGFPPKPGEGLGLQLGLRGDAVAGTGAARVGTLPTQCLPSSLPPNPLAGPDRICYHMAAPGPGSLRRYI